MRNCLTKWYESKSPEELLELLFGERKLEEICHQKIVKILRPKSKNAEKQELFIATLKNYKEIKESAKSSPTLKKVLILKDLKRCKDVPEVLEILNKKELQFKLHHLPTFAVKSTEVIELILPNLTIDEIIESLPTFADRKLLKDSTSKKISNALQCSAKIVNEAKLNPIRIFEVIKKISGPEVLFIKKEETPEAEKKVMNPSLIVQKLRNLFNQSLSEQPKTGCRFFVTLDVRKFSKRRKLKINKVWVF